MNKIVEFIGKRGLYFLSTLRDSRPRIRPFGFCLDYDGAILIPTEKTKNCYLEMKENPHVELCACHDDLWVRVSGEVKELRNSPAYEIFFQQVPLLKKYFRQDDPNFVLFELHGTALFFDNEELLEKIDF